MVKKHRKPKHDKPSDVRELVKTAAATRYFRQEPWTEHWLNAITAPPLDIDITYRRLKALLSGPNPVNGAQSRHPSMDKRSLFYDFIRHLRFLATPQVVGGLDDVNSAVCWYAKLDLDDSPPLNGWPRYVPRDH